MKTKHRVASQHKRRHRDDLAVYKTVGRSATAMLTPSEITTCALPVHVGWEAIKTGKGSGRDVRVITEALSICVIAAEEIDPFLEETSISAAQAICGIAERYARIGRIGVDAAALRDIPPALEFYDALLSTATSGQLFGWTERVMQVKGVAQ